MVMKFSRSRRGKAWGALSAGFALLLGLVLANPALAEKRVALVIGNSAYTGDMPPLPNPANDAKLMEGALKAVGFDVVSVTDATKDQMTEALGQFRDKLLAAGTKPTGLVFYAGHGLQVAGENYLIPVDAEIKAEKDVMLASLSADMVMKQMNFAEPGVKIVILDACRNNPLASSERTASRGLAKMENATTGTFLAFSTAPGSTAADGDGVNSPYTKALAETITEPGLSIADVFQEVRTKVLASTGNVQTPWDSSSLTGRFFFKDPDPSQMAAVTPPPAAPAAPAGPDAKDIEDTFWDTVKDSTDSEDLQAYLAKYPSGRYAELAQFKLDKLNAGTQVAGADTPSDARQGAQPAEPAVQTATPTPSDPELSFITLDQTMYARPGGQLRAQPSTAAKLVSKLKANTELSVSGLSTDGEWWRVALADGRSGYLHSSMVLEQPE
jgi:carboxyl-terminal processing protease